MPQTKTQTTSKEKKPSLKSISKDFEAFQKLGNDIGKSAQDLDKSIETEVEKKQRIVKIEKGLLKLSKKIDNRMLRLEIEEEIKRSSTNENFDGVIGRMKTSSSIKDNPEALEQIEALELQQNKYGALSYKLNKLQDIKNNLPSFLRDKHDLTGIPVDQLIDEYYEYDSTKGKWRAKTATEIAQEAAKEEKGLSKGWAFVKAFIKGNILFRHTKKMENIVDTHKTVQTMYEDVKEDYGEVFKKAKEVGKQAKEIAVEAKKGVKYASAELRENPEALAAANAIVARVKGRLNTGVDNVARNVVNNQKSNKALTALKETYAQSMKEVQKAGPIAQRRLAQEASKGRVPGMGFKTAGKFAVLSVLSVAVRDAIMERDPSRFVDNISNSNLWTEAIPLVGSCKSISRVFKDNGDPAWAKAVDVGINLLGDGFLIAGLVGSFFSFGATGAAGLGIKTALVTAGRSVLKLGTGQGAKQAVKAGASAVAGSFLKKKITQRVIVEGGQEMVEQTIKQGSKTVVKKVPADQARRTWRGKLVKEYSEKSLVRQSIGTIGKYTLGMTLLEKGLEQVFPPEKIKDMTMKFALDEVNQRVDEHVSPGMRDLYKTISGNELPVGTAA